MEFSLFLSSYIRKQQVFDMNGEILQVEYFSSWEKHVLQNRNRIKSSFLIKENALE
jgi:hypothetical protein